MPTKSPFCPHILPFSYSVALLCSAKKPSSENKSPIFRLNKKSLNHFNVYSLRNAYGLYFETERIKAIMGLLNEHRITLQGKKILDVGCNYGLYANLFAYLSRDPSRIYGIDFIHHSISTAKKIHPGISYIQHDLYEDMPDFNQGKFDLILVNYVMNCITESRAEVFNTISSQLKPGGHMLLFDFFIKDSPGFTERWLYTPKMRAKREQYRKKRMQTYPYLNDNEIKKHLPECAIIASGTLIPYDPHERPSRVTKWVNSIKNIFNRGKKAYYIALLRKETPRL